MGESRVDPLFGIEARAQGWVPSPGYLLRRDRILHHLRQIPRGLEVLEIGCGAGALLADLRALGHRCTAVETSETARGAAAALHEADAGVVIALGPEADWAGRFDLVAAFEVLEHIEDDAGALKQWLGYAKPGGWLALSVPGGPHRWDASDEWAGHVRRYTREGLRAVVDAAGGEVVVLESYGFPLANMIAPVRAWSKRRGADPGSAEARTARSGVDRSIERRMLPVLRSWPGRLALRAAFQLQHWFAGTDRGPGFFLLARRLPPGRAQAQEDEARAERAEDGT